MKKIRGPLFLLGNQEIPDAFPDIQLERTDLQLILYISKGETYTFVTHSLPRAVWSHSPIYAFQQFTKKVTAAPRVRPLPALENRYCPSS